MTRSHQVAQRGFSLVAAIFLLVVLAGLGVFAVRINTLQQQTVTAALRGSQAFQAARSGVAWGAYQAMAADACSAPTATLNLTEGATVGFRVTVSCSKSTHTEGTTGLCVFVFDVRAEAGAYGGPDYVSRRVQAKVMDTPCA
jgi:MSHA biogenesis protein MshP